MASLDLSGPIITLTEEDEQRLLESVSFVLSIGCKSIFRKIIEFKIWKKPILVVKQ